MAGKGVLTTGMALALAGLLFPSIAAAQFPPVVRTSDFDGNNGFTVHGTVLEQFGNSVAGLGDINADGIDDIGSGAAGLAWYPDCYCEPTIGMVNVIFGNADVGSDGVWTVDKLDGSNGFRIPEIGQAVYGTGFGSMSRAGDFNNDGIDDLLVGASGTDHWVYVAAGACYVIYGRPGLGAGGSFDLSLLDGSNGFAIYGHFGLAQIGGRKAAIRDFNADGVDDILLSSIRGSPGGRTYAGQCYVVFGGTDIGSFGEFSLADLTPGTGVLINGIAPGDSAGMTLSSAGDVNGDGFWDIMIGTSKDVGRGEAYVLFGGPDVSTIGVIELSSLNGKNGFVIRAAGSSIGYSGKSVAGLGDVNGDGFDDVALNDRNSSSDSWVDVIFGAPNIGAGGEFHASTLNGTNGFTIVGNPPPETGTVSGPKAVGDINADGFNDILVVGSTWVVYGGADVGRSGFIAIYGSGGQLGFRLETDESPFDRAGAGDVNNDGIDDIVVATPYSWHVPTGADLGEVDVLFGRRMGDVDLDADVDIHDFATWPSCMLGPGGAVTSACRVFDFNHDGHVDLADFAGFQEAFQQSVSHNAQ